MFNESGNYYHKKKTFIKREGCKNRLVFGQHSAAKMSISIIELIK